MRLASTAAVRSGLRCCVGLAAIFGAMSASAVTLHDLSDPEFAGIYGRYAPNGDCTRTPMVTIDNTGFAFRTKAGTSQSTTFEYALSFFGPDYSGIAKAIFPFPVSEYEPGHVLMYVNADEQRGKLAFESNLGPGEKYSPLEAQLVAASPLVRCKT